MITFKSIGHFFAKAFKVIGTDLAKIEGTKATVETVSQVVDPAIVPIEDAAYAVLGEISSALTAGGDAVAAKLQDAGLDVNVINMVKGILKGVPHLVTVAKKL